jgi:hypothetical protein
MRRGRSADRIRPTQLSGELFEARDGADGNLVEPFAQLAGQAGQAVAHVVDAATDAVEPRRELGDPAHQCAGLGAARGHRPGQPATEPLEVAAHTSGLGPQGVDFGSYRGDLGAQGAYQRRDSSSLTLRLVHGRGSQQLDASGQRVGFVDGFHTTPWFEVRAA